MPRNFIHLCGLNVVSDVWARRHLAHIIWTRCQDRYGHCADWEPSFLFIGQGGSLYQDIISLRQGLTASQIYADRSKETIHQYTMKCEQICNLAANNLGKSEQYANSLVNIFGEWTAFADQHSALYHVRGAHSHVQMVSPQTTKYRANSDIANTLLQNQVLQKTVEWIRGLKLTTQALSIAHSTAGQIACDFVNCQHSTGARVSMGVICAIWLASSARLIRVHRHRLILLQLPATPAWAVKSISRRTASTRCALPYPARARLASGPCQGRRFGNRYVDCTGLQQCASV